MQPTIEVHLLESNGELQVTKLQYEIEQNISIVSTLSRCVEASCEPCLSVLVTNIIDGPTTTVYSWESLKSRFDHQKYVILPKAKHEWLNLRFLDYKSVGEYNSAMFNITSRMILCGEKVSDHDMIEKTLSTFHLGNVVLQEQYRAKEYTRYSDLMQVLLVAEQNNELITMNHQTRPTGSAPTRRHWNGIKNIFRYLQGTIDLGLHYTRNSKVGLVGFADAGYLSDPHKARSQTGYVFTYGGTAISWRSQKQTLVATSSNYAEIIALHEASRECVWLRSMTQYILEASGIDTTKEPTTIYEDNSACVTQIKEGFIKSDRTKHIPPRFFTYTQELENSKEIDVQYIRSSDNAADLFTKALPTSIFKKHIQSIGMRHLRDL